MDGKIVFLLCALHFIVGETQENVPSYDFASCDRQIKLNPHQSTSLRSPNWPATYVSGSSCRYNIQALYDYQIQVTCSIDLEDSNRDGSCVSERFYISEDGNPDISRTQPVCGRTIVSRTSLRNAMTLAYTSGIYSGMFDCQLTAVCDCGWGLNARIVGGKEALLNEFPSTAALYSTRYEIFRCGATIVSSQFVVTAAHCLRDTPYKESAVLVGDYDLSTGYDTQQARLHPVIRYIEHPGYSDVTRLNDIGLVQTSFPMSWSRGVAPVCLPFVGVNFNGLNVIATGWGTTSFAGKLASRLRKVDLRVLKNTDSSCVAAYPQIQDSQMCTYNKGKDTCQVSLVENEHCGVDGINFDSGGGLYYSGLTGSRKFLVGQVSYARCAGSSPSLNTRITDYLAWIERNTGPLCRRVIE